MGRELVAIAFLVAVANAGCDGGDDPRPVNVQPVRI